MVLRKMVKHFRLSEAYDPINTNPSKPVLLISKHEDFDKGALLAKAVAKDLSEKNALQRLKATIRLHMKEDGPHVHLRHQHEPDKDGTMGYKNV